MKMTPPVMEKKNPQEKQKLLISSEIRHLCSMPL